MDSHDADLVIPVTPMDHARGAPRPRVTIVEYGDFECSVCKAVEPGVRMLLNHFAEDVRLIYRHFVMESAHPYALLAAEAAEAAAAQGKFWEMHDQLLREGANLDRASLIRYAETLGFDIALFQSSLDDEIYRQRVREQMEGAARSHLRATPGFFVNGHVCDVSGGVHALSERVTTLL